MTTLKDLWPFTPSNVTDFHPININVGNSHAFAVSYSIGED